jgi:cyclase
MLKIRVLPTLLYKDVGLVKGIRFDSWRRVGSAMQAVKVYNLRQVDELVFLDIAATHEQRLADTQVIDELADECFMPLTVGGGVRSLDDARRLLMVGADKVAMNSGAFERPELLREVASELGSQCAVLCIDASKRTDGTYAVVTHAGTRQRDMDVVEFARIGEAMGAGEIILTSIDRDGTMEGYDCGLVRQVSDAVGIPVVASGGAGTYSHMAEVLRDGGASAVAAASMYHFTEQTPLGAKRYLAAQGFAVRL